MRISLSLILSLFSLIFAAQAALLGIDFGTEFTKAILVAPNVPFDILLTSESKRKDVSGLALSFDNKGENNVEVHRMFGTHALSTCIKTPQSCLLYPKSLLGIGSKSEQINDYLSKFPNTGVGLQNGRDAASIVVFNKDHTYNDTFLIEEVAAMIFMEIKNRALEYWEERSPETVGTIDEVAISVPRYFNEAARIAITDAAELAGLKVVTLVDDGLAIALDYAQKRNDFKLNEREYHLIFDCGAGATKLSLVSFTNVDDVKVNIEMENYAFSEQFNGQLITKAVRNIILTQFAEKNNIDTNEIINDAKAMQKLWQAADKAKLILSANQDTKVNIESVYQNIDFRGVITREELEQILSPSLTAISYLIDSVFVGHEDIKKNIDSVILAGGSIRVPAVQQELIKYFGSENVLSKNVNADESVVFGTTLRGAQILKLTRKNQFNVIDRSPYHYGLFYKTDDGSKSGKIEVPAGLMTSEKHVANLTNFEGEFLPKFSVDVFLNNDVLSHQYNFTMPHRVNRTTCESPFYEMSYGLTRHNAFIIHNVKIHCTYNETTKATSLLSHSKLQGFEPMPAMMKKTSIQRLTSLEMQEVQRHKLAESKNQLEAKLYELRYVVEEYENVFADELVDELNKVISENLEWLDYDSDDATLPEVVKRVENVKSLMKDVRKYTQVATPELAKINIVDAYETLLQKKDEVQKKIEEVVSEKEMIMKAQCEAFKIDYTEIDSKFSWPNVNVDSQLQQIQELSDLALSTENNDEFKKLVPELSKALDIINETEKALTASLDDVERVYQLKSALVRQKVLAAEKAARRAAEASTETTSTTTADEDADVEHDEL
ncbi:hypothetical protein CANINC_000716 [Pichia inconspicua]|uniref:Uncharacterized protein n=1 Tax=Pichia inconspicua TaxID=52247 RepID=A0A4V6TTT4_9ASCO|nr:hypothetical protein CANINC_000716 [[Candida] inconspicua]